MNSKNKIIIIIAVIIIIALLVSLFTKINKNSNKNEEENQNSVVSDITEPSTQSSDGVSVIDVAGTQNTKINESGIRVNTSENLKKEQNLSGIKISNTTIQYLGGLSELTADIKNDTTADINTDINITIKIKDSEGKVAREFNANISTLKKNETKKINASITSSIVNATDVEYVINK